MTSESDIIERRRKEPWWQRTLRETAIHDFAVFAFLLFLNGAVLGTPNSPERSACLVRTGGLLLAFLVSIVPRYDDPSVGVAFLANAAQGSTPSRVCVSDVTLSLAGRR